jgi:hypothetical protein
LTVLTDEINRAMVESWKIARSLLPKTESFDKLMLALDGDELMAEMMWSFWYSGAWKIVDKELLYFNPHLRWWKFKQ